MKEAAGFVKSLIVSLFSRELSSGVQGLETLLSPNLDLLIVANTLPSLWKMTIRSVHIFLGAKYISGQK